MLEITSAKQVNDYKIEIIFNDKTKGIIKGIIDLKDVIFSDHRKIFQQLKDPKKFNKFKIEFDTLTWENGLDLAPEFLYDLLKNNKNLI